MNRFPKVVLPCGVGSPLPFGDIIETGTVAGQLFESCSGGSGDTTQGIFLHRVMAPDRQGLAVNSGARRGAAHRTEVVASRNHNHMTDPSAYAGTRF